MTRGGFLKSLIAVIAAPKVLAEINFSKPIISASVKNVMNANLFADLQLLRPEWHSKFVERYGNDNFMYWNTTYNV